jgi:hypothetical protein
MHESQNKSNTPIDERLAQWQVNAPVDPQLKQHVLRRIAVLDSEDSRTGIERFSLIRWLLSNPIAACVFALAVLVITGTSLMVAHERSLRMQMAQSQLYFLIIDPVARAQAADEHTLAGKNGEPNVVEMLAWMKTRFNLSREQFAQLVVLHKEYSDKLMTLYAELRDLDAGYQTFEKQRLNDDMIDFMALYDLLRKRDAVRADSTTTSHQLVELVLRVLTPEQKREYLSLLNKDGSLPEKLPDSPNPHAGA